MKLNLFLALAVISVSSGAKDHCHDHSDLAERFELCTENAEKGLMPSKKEVDVANGSDLCSLLEVIVSVCGQIYSECLDRNDFEKFQDSQIEHFLQTINHVNSGVSQIFSNCSIVGHFLQRKSKNSSAVSKCNEEENYSSTINYHECVNAVNKEVSSLMSKSSGNLAKQQTIFCNGIFKATYACALNLKRCFTTLEIGRKILQQKLLIRKIVKSAVGEVEGQFDEVNPQTQIDIDRCSVYGGNIGPDLSHSKARSVANQASQVHLLFHLLLSTTFFMHLLT